VRRPLERSGALLCQDFVREFAARTVANPFMGRPTRRRAARTVDGTITPVPTLPRKYDPLVAVAKIGEYPLVPD
jgi:hypothetical protein